MRSDLLYQYRSSWKKGRKANAWVYFVPFKGPIVGGIIHSWTNGSTALGVIVHSWTNNITA
jgi:uncharacterized protein (DUF697 family)